MAVVVAKGYETLCHRLVALGAGVRIEPAAARRNNTGQNRNNRDDEQYRPKRDALLML